MNCGIMNSFKSSGAICIHTQLKTTLYAVPVKGWDILLSSFEDIAPEKPEARLLFVGSINSSHEVAFAKSLKERAKQNGLSDKVCFLGQRDDIAHILTISDVFVLPSRSEGQPGALVEAMASGLPCVGTRVGGVPEVITDGYDGLLVEREDVGAMTQAVKKLLENKNLRIKIYFRYISLHREENLVKPVRYDADILFGRKY